MQTTKLTSKSILPLTCTRSGTCCFGKSVMLNPWEIVCFSKAKKITPREFRDLYCEFGGIKLRFNGKEDKKGQKSCSQYIDDFGCSVHEGRPLACRLYPLGRQIQFDKAQYIFEGTTFPCLIDCADVLNLPKIRVDEYLKGQKADLFEKAQDAYLIVMQNIADIGFELFLDSGLSESGDTKTLKVWRKLGKESPELLAKKIGKDWIDDLMVPKISNNIENPILFAQKHNDLLIEKAQEQFGSIQTIDELHKASVLMIALALHLAKGLGADTQGIAEHWIETAKRFGAKE
jgi:Fe-S-cluster containining protein